MCRAVCVLGLLALCVGITLSWDFAVSLRNQIIFFTNGTISNDVLLLNQNPTALVYDETQDRILYINKQSNDDVICGFYIVIREHECFTERKGYNIHSFAFDPVTETIFFTETRTNNIYMISLNFSSTGIVYALDNVTPADIVVDSCQGYIYWVNKLINGNRKLLERGRFNSTGREVIFKRGYFQIHDLAIDLHTQNLYYFDEFDGFGYINSLDFGAKETSLLELHAPSTILTVSKDYIYFTRSNESEDTVWQLPKSARLHIIYPELVKKMDNVKILGIVANYKLVDQIKGIQGCESLTSLLSKPVVPASVDEQLNITVSKNNSQHSNYSFNDEELLKSSCIASNSGNRCPGYCSNNGTCSLNEKNEPTCQCIGGYVGEICEVSPCLNYCLQGSCTVNDDAFPECSCNVGYSGDRCEVNVCQGYCLNNGDCFLNEENEPVCQCDGNHDGSRCEAGINTTTPIYDAAKRNQTLSYFLSILRKPSSKLYLTVEV